MPGSRVCEGCGKSYTLPLPYEQANPVIRDFCFDCVTEKVMNPSTIAAVKAEPVKEGMVGDWYV